MNVELFQLYEHQFAVDSALALDVKEKIIIVKACRQVGKTMLAVYELLKFASLTKKVSAYVTTSIKQAKEVFAHVLNCAPELVRTKNAQTLEIYFINGARISFFSTEQREKLRGYTVNGILIIDEASSVPDDIYYQLLRPWTNTHRAPTLIISTPCFERGFFFDLYRRGLQEDPVVKSFDFMNYTESLNQLRPASVLEDSRLTVPPQIFKAEYLGLFLKAEGTVFGNFEAQILQHKSEAPTEMYFGIDWASGSGGDYTVVAGMNQSHELCFLWRDNSLEPVKQIEYIKNIFDKYSEVICGVEAEKNSIGAVYLSIFKEKKIHVRPFVTTQESKRKLVEMMQVDIQRQKVFFIDDNNLKIEFSSYESKPVGRGVSYSAPPGLHDDIVMATLIANDCYNRAKGQKKNRYKIL